MTNTGSDDSSWGPYALGFTFNFNGTAFTTAGVCDNGFIAFGGAATSSYTSLSSGTANNVAAAFNYDLYGLAGNGAKLMYQLSGSPGSQVYTFEWKNWGFYSLGANELSFQIKLYEGSNRVQFVYQNGTGTATSAVQVGLRGTTAASFLNRTTATDWNATTAGAVNTATCSVSSTVRPTNGLIYNWDPPSASISWLPITYLDNPAIATPLASGVGATTIYTATANSGGCTATSSATVTVANPLASGSTITPASPFYCGPTGSVTLTAIPGGGGGPWNFQWTDPLLNVGPTTTTATQVANIPGVWSVYITDACGGFDNASTTVVQRAVPTATAGSNVGCLGQALNLTGATDIGTTYAWTGPNAFTSAALNPTIASVVAANAGVYSFTAAFNGCTSLPSTVTVGANPVPSITSVTATLATICAGSTSQLNAVATINGNYTVGAITYAPPSPISTSLSGVGPTGDEGTVSATIGFPFSFFGTSYSSVTVHTNGYIVFSGYVFGAYSPPAIPNTANTNNWVGYWADLNASAGQITYGTIGTTPNRKFIVNYNQEPYYSATPYYSGQVVLNEFDNTIDLL